MNQTISPAARIVVVDDHGIVRFGYSQLINQEPDMEVCGLASNEQEGIMFLSRESPDLVIVDLTLKEGSGMDLVQSAIKICPAIKILVISAHDESLFAHRVLAAGAHGYINKEEAPEKLIEGIHALLGGDFFFSKSVTKNLIRRRLGDPKPATMQGLESLTNRELQVFEQIGNGRSTREIADALFLSVKTIERHKENIKSKLNVDNATQLVQHATRWVLKRGY
ncbi:Oxygen regulatory protein NreC [Novipirellula galeiformis]|uniref:Oxygen regulatory protein NreC n=1 Tax=Novipirellula galeiformis TaxID=2528004 RepID=A0A5C6CKL1_9BACT|nr:response regulator transcription factor [Novipirellula galeiformis]TWU24988.1 Oxygen regulatory protein NreC [Novipirellula galeiformis]